MFLFLIKKYLVLEILLDTHEKILVKELNNVDSVFIVLRIHFFNVFLIKNKVFFLKFQITKNRKNAFSNELVNGINVCREAFLVRFSTFNILEQK